PEGGSHESRFVSAGRFFRPGTSIATEQVAFIFSGDLFLQARQSMSGGFCLHAELSGLPPGLLGVVLVQKLEPNLLRAFLVSRTLFVMNGERLASELPARVAPR